MKLWHVTERKWAQDILKAGFYGSWGDCAFGVYLFDDLGMAMDWEEHNPNMRYQDPVILEVQVREDDVQTCDQIMGGIPADWESEREKYDHTLVHEMDEDDEEDRWRPQAVSIY